MTRKILTAIGAILLPLALSAQQVDITEQSGKTALTITLPQATVTIKQDADWILYSANVLTAGYVISDIWRSSSGNLAFGLILI